MPIPERLELAGDWEHLTLHRNVKAALLTLPLYFRTQTVIEGISAVDIFTLNAALGATIENQVVATLNQMRRVWDPENKYMRYAFVRQAQTFPDVLLRAANERGEEFAPPLMSIELKGWYLLAKEAEPSFRFSVTPECCAPQDLIAVVPWALTNVISGSPTVYNPFIESARYAAEYRNHHWEHLRATGGDRGLRLATGASPYPRKSDKIADVPVSDSGGNFGRFARTGLMDTYLTQAKQELLAGIRAGHWLGFFKLFQDQSDRAEISGEIEKLKRKISGTNTVPDSRIEAVWEILANLERLLE